MKVEAIQNKTKFINNPDGEVVEVILPYKVYQELLELKTSVEIYQQKDVQQSIQRGKRDVRIGRIKKIDDIDEAIKWLDK